MTPNPQPSSLPRNGNSDQGGVALPDGRADQPQRDIFDEIMPPMKLVMCEPRYLSTRVSNNKWMKHEEIDVPRALRQFARAQNIFNALDVETALIPPVPECQDQCFTLDTKISLLDGTEKSFEELLSHDDEIWVYSYDAESRRIVPGKASKPFKTGANVPVLKVELDNGETVRCTPQHLWLMRDGTYRRADQLSAGDSLMPLYRKPAEEDCPGYEMLLDPANEQWVFTHRRVCESVNQSALLDSNKQLQIVEGKHGDARHHLNFNERDNRPTNLAWINFAAHRAYHSSLNHVRWSNPEFRARMAAKTAKQWENPVYREKMRKVSSETLKRSHQDPVFAAQHSTKQRKLLKDLNQDPEFAAARDRRASDQFKRLRPLQAQDPEWLAKQSSAASRNMKRLGNDPSFVAARNAALARRNGDAEFIAASTERLLRYRRSAEGVESNRQALARLRQTLWTCETCDVTMSLMGKGSHVRHKHAPVNHKVVSVIEDGRADVYDITVDKYHNFALSAGVFVHNCYVANVAIAIKPYIILANYKAEGRACEVEPARQFFESLGYQCVQPPFHFEGEADLKKVSEGVYIGGYGQFTDIQTYQWIEELTGVQIVPVHEISEQLYHLDCSLLIVDEQHALVTGAGLDPNSIKAIEQILNITMTPRGKGLVHTGITNAVLVPDKRIVCSGTFNPELSEYRTAMSWMNKTFDSFGYTCVFLDVDEFDKSGADLSCCVMHLDFSPEEVSSNGGTMRSPDQTNVETGPGAVAPGA